MIGKKQFKIIFVMALIIMTMTFFAGCSVMDKTDMSKYSSFKYIGSKSSKKFHTRGCFLGKRIALEDAAFFSTRSDALNAGYAPDNVVCHP